MTKKERRNPKLLQASRKKRIAAGSGLDVADINKLIKMHMQMGDVMKKMGKMGKGGMMRQGLASMFGVGGKGMTPPGGMGGDMGLGNLPTELPKGMTLPGGLSGLGKKK